MTEALTVILAFLAPIAGFIAWVKIDLAINRGGDGC